MDPLEPFAAEVRELMSVSPDEFTARRDALVRALRDDGARDAASELASLRRPSPALWAANQLRSRSPEIARELFESGDALRTAQSRMLAGEKGVELTEPAENHRQAVIRAVNAGQEALREAGRPGTAAMLARLRETLVGGSLGETSREPLAEGRLLAEVPAASIGFAASAGAAGATRTERVAQESAAEASRRTVRERARRRSEAEQALADGEQLRDRALERLQGIQAERGDLERAHTETQRLRTDAERARAAAEVILERARAEETSANREAARAEERAVRARAAEDAAQRALEEARSVVDRARQRMRSVDRERGDN